MGAYWRVCRCPCERVYERAVAQSLLDNREQTLSHLRRRGALTLDVPADRISASVINRYLEVKAKTLYGFARGYAFVDLDEGMVSLCKAYIDLTVELPVQDKSLKEDRLTVRAGGTMEMLMQRSNAGR